MPKRIRKAAGTSRYERAQQLDPRNSAFVDLNHFGASSKEPHLGILFGITREAVADVARCAVSLEHAAPSKRP